VFQAEESQVRGVFRVQFLPSESLRSARKDQCVFCYCRVLSAVTGVVVGRVMEGQLRFKETGLEGLGEYKDSQMHR
jgi:hypothetical protein